MTTTRPPPTGPSHDSDLPSPSAVSDDDDTPTSALANGTTTLSSHDDQHPQLSTTVKLIGFPVQCIDARQGSYFFLLTASALMTTAATPSPSIDGRYSPSRVSGHDSPQP